MKERENSSEHSTQGAVGYFKESIGYWLGLISSILTIIGFFVKEVPLWLCVTWFVIVGGFVVVLFADFLKHIMRNAVSESEYEEYYRLQAIERVRECQISFKKCAEELHKHFHNMRDVLCSYKTSSDFDSDYFEQILRNVCTEIEVAFSKIWEHEKISVCIKRIIVDDNMQEDFTQWRIETMARSIGTKQDRNLHNKEPVLIANNSDFKVIIDPQYGDSVFTCMDLTKVKETFLDTYKEEYRNSTEDYIKYYKSTIIAPIRVRTSKMNKGINAPWTNKISYHILGFLCIDTEEVFSDGVELFDTGIELAKALADILYKLVELSILPSTKQVLSTD